jgi:hypothetical protein
MTYSQFLIYATMIGLLGRATPDFTCRLATTGNLAGYTYANGTAGVGATLTAGSIGLLTSDGVTPSVADRILVKSQTTPAQNGIYVVTVNSGGAAAVLTRATDYDTPADIQAGAETNILNGTTLAGTQWIMTQTATIVIGTTDITYIESSVSGAALVANNLSDLLNKASANINLGGLGASVSITIPAASSYVCPVPTPKVIRATFDSATTSKFVLPISNDLGSPNQNSPGIIFLINESSVGGKVYSYGTNGTDGILISAIAGLSGLILWNESNSSATGNWHAYDYVIPAQIKLTAYAQTTDDTVTTLLSVAVAEASKLIISGTYSAADPDYTPGICQAGNFLVSATRAVGGDITLLGIPLINAVNSEPPVLTADVDVGTQTLRLRVQGDELVTYNWNMTYTTSVT